MRIIPLHFVTHCHLIGAVTYARTTGARRAKRALIYVPSSYRLAICCRAPRARAASTFPGLRWQYLPCLRNSRHRKPPPVIDKIQDSKWVRQYMTRARYREIRNGCRRLSSRIKKEGLRTNPSVRSRSILACHPVHPYDDDVLTCAGRATS